MTEQNVPYRHQVHENSLQKHNRIPANRAHVPLLQAMHMHRPSMQESIFEKIDTADGFRKRMLYQEIDPYSKEMHPHGIFRNDPKNTPYSEMEKKRPLFLQAAAVPHIVYMTRRVRLLPRSSDQKRKRKDDVCLTHKRTFPPVSRQFVNERFPVHRLQKQSGQNARWS